MTAISLSSSQDILYLREKDLTTEGIFVTSPNEISCKTLKEKLDSGKEVDIKNHLVYDMAWILNIWKVLGSFTLRILLSLHKYFPSSCIPLSDGRFLEEKSGTKSFLCYLQHKE